MYSNKLTAHTTKLELESRTGEFVEVAPLVSGMRGREVLVAGDVQHGVWYAGQVMGLIHDVPTCAELISRIEHEARETLTRLEIAILNSEEQKIRL
ncbi:hypothetical protein V492_06327 [Pseudogymnoascus sp. VKM F-4246]|nr:hypothetical protein V492_06327 [Pseudogymnoascus sp. VKM F-4246]